VRWFDSAQVQPLEVIEGPAADRKYGNDDKLPWQEQSGSVEEAKSIGNFYDNVAGVLRGGAEQIVTPESVRETMRVISMIRKGTGFPGKPRKAPDARSEAVQAEVQ
jgi:hypothetical protein